MRWLSLRRFFRREAWFFGRTAWIFWRALLFAAGGVTLCAVTGVLVRVGPAASKKAGQFSVDHWQRFVTWLPHWMRIVPEGLQWLSTHLWKWLKALWSWLGFPPKPLQVLLLAFAAVIVWYLWRELRRPVLIIEPFDVPKALSDEGISPRVFASWIGAELPELKRSIFFRSNSAAKVTFSHHSLPDIQIPEAKIGLRAIIEFLRDLLGWHMLRISGDIVGTSDDWTVTVYESWGRNQARVGRESIRTLESEMLVKKATKLALKAEEPFLFGVLLHSGEDVESALKLAREMALHDQEVVERMGGKAAKRRRIDGHLLWSFILTQQKDYDEALKHVSCALHLDRRSARAYNGWGFVLGTKGEHLSAIEKFKRATALNPKYAAVYYNWGHSLTQLPDPNHPAAIEKFKRAVTLDPKFANAYYNWAYSLAELSDHPAAIEKYETATTLNPKFANAYYNWACSLHAMGRYEEAEALFKKAEELGQ